MWWLDALKIMGKIFRETRASTNHPSNNPGKARLRNGAEILVLFPHLCSRIWVHDWPDKKAIVDLPITLEGNSKHVTSIRWVRIGAAFQTLLIGVTLGLRRRLIYCYINVKRLPHQILVVLFFLSMQKSPSARPTPEAVMVGSVWHFVYQLRLQNHCCCCCYYFLISLSLSLSLSLWMLDTSIHRIKWWRKCGHYIHVGVSSARTEKITWPKLGLANFRIILKASAFLLF